MARMLEDVDDRGAVAEAVGDAIRGHVAAGFAAVGAARAAQLRAAHTACLRAGLDGDGLAAWLVNDLVHALAVLGEDAAAHPVGWSPATDPVACLLRRELEAALDAWAQEARNV